MTTNKKIQFQRRVSKYTVNLDFDFPIFGFFAYFGKSFVYSVASNQFFVRSAFRYFPVVDNEYSIGFSDRCQPMRYRYYRFAFRQFGNRVLNQVFVFGIDACGRFLIAPPVASVFRITKRLIHKFFPKRLIAVDEF